MNYHERCALKRNIKRVAITLYLLGSACAAGHAASAPCNTPQWCNDRNDVTFLAAVLPLYYLSTQMWKDAREDG